MQTNTLRILAVPKPVPLNLCTSQYPQKCLKLLSLLPKPALIYACKPTGPWVGSTCSPLWLFVVSFGNRTVVPVGHRVICWSIHSTPNNIQPASLPWSSLQQVLVPPVLTQEGHSSWSLCFQALELWGCQERGRDVHTLLKHNWQIWGRRGAFLSGVWGRK